MAEQEPRLSTMYERIARLEEINKAAEKALVVTRTELERRLESMNEFRAQMTVERGTFVLREMYDREHETLKHRVSQLELSRSGALGSITAVASIFSIIIAIAAIAIAWMK